MIYGDFPFSLVLVARGWRNDNFLFWFATLDTCGGISCVGRPIRS